MFVHLFRYVSKKLIEMRFLKRTALLFILLVLFFSLALWGFIKNFPGKSIADAASNRLSSQTGMNIEFQDFELGWSKISTPEISISTPNWQAGSEMRLLIFKNVEAPFTSIISSGKGIINGELHEGSVQISSELISPKKLNMSLGNVQIETVPLFALMPNTFVSGSLSMSIHISNLKDLYQKRGFPEGNLRGKIKDARIRISSGLFLLDLQLPELTQTEILFDLEIGPVISLKEVKFKGSLEGTVSGTIELNNNHLNMSLIDLNFVLTPSPDFKKELSRFNKILASFKCGETLNVNMKGTFNRLNLPTRNICSQ